MNRNGQWGMELKDNGRVVNSAYNILILFENHLDFRDKFIYDKSIEKELYNDKSLTRDVLDELKFHVEELLRIKVSKSNVKCAALVACHRHCIDSLKK